MPRRVFATVGLALALLVALVAADLACPAPAQARDWSWLGVRIRDLTEQEMEEISSRHGLREGFGVVIVEVLENTPAASAGLRNGDVVVGFEGRPVTETRLLQRLIAQAPVGRDTQLTVLRSEGRAPLTVRLVLMPRPMVGERVAAEFGFILRDPEAAGAGPAREDATQAPTVGVVVRGSPAERAGLEAGDLIVQVGDRPVLTRDAAREALSDQSTERPLRLTLRRDGRSIAVTVPAP